MVMEGRVKTEDERRREKKKKKKTPTHNKSGVKKKHTKNMTTPTIILNKVLKSLTVNLPLIKPHITRRPDTVENGKRKYSDVLVKGEEGFEIFL
jgi:hypothetical protein